MASIYVGTFAKYNAGSLTGKWIDPTDYYDKSSFLEACAELHQDEADPEFMFQDSEGIPKLFITESSVSEEYWDFSDGDNEEARTAFVDCFGEWDKDKFDSQYIGKFDNRAAFADDFLEQQGALSSLPQNLVWYFDFEKFADDMFTGGEVQESNNHYFRTE